MRFITSNYALRIQARDYTDRILLRGWDWNPQSYSMNGLGFLGMFFFSLSFSFQPITDFRSELPVFPPRERQETIVPSIVEAATQTVKKLVVWVNGILSAAVE